MMEEHIFLHENNVLVSNARFVIDRKETYAMDGIVYIKLGRRKKKIRYMRIAIGLIVFVIGLAVAFFHLLGVLGIIAGLLFIATSMKKIPYTIEIKTTAGEEQVYSDKDGEFIQKVYQALNDALIFRG